MLQDLNNTSQDNNMEGDDQNYPTPRPISAAGRELQRTASTEPPITMDIAVAGTSRRVNTFSDNDGQDYPTPPTSAAGFHEDVQRTTSTEPPILLNESVAGTSRRVTTFSDNHAMCSAPIISADSTAIPSQQVIQPPSSLQHTQEAAQSNKHAEAQATVTSVTKTKPIPATPKQKAAVVTNSSSSAQNTSQVAAKKLSQSLIAPWIIEVKDEAGKITNKVCFIKTIFLKQNFYVKTYLQTFNNFDPRAIGQSMTYVLRKPGENGTISKVSKQTDKFFYFSFLNQQLFSHLYIDSHFSLGQSERSTIGKLASFWINYGIEFHYVDQFYFILFDFK